MTECPGKSIGCHRATFCEGVTVDFAEDLKPDTVSNIKSIPIKDAAFDVVCSFQVLEHIPWREVPDVLRKMGRLSRKHVLFSVPDNNVMRNPIYSVKLSLLNRFIGYSLTKKRYEGVSNVKEHYYEIEVSRVTVDILKEIIDKNSLTLIDNWLDGVDRYFLCKISP